jgi:YVTN family beta-propeller protein
MRKRAEILALIILLSVFVAPVRGQQSTPTRVFVVNTQDASVSLVDISSMKEVRRIPVGPRPYGVVVSRDGRTLAVGVEDEEKVKFFDTTNFKLVGETRVGKMFNDHMVLSTDGKFVLVANFYSDDVVAIDLETMKEAFRIKGASAPHVIKYGPLRKRAYVTCKKITGIAIVDPESRQLVKFHQINVNPRSLTFSPDEAKIYFGSFWVNGFFEMDAESGKVTRLFALDPPAGDTSPQEVTYHGVETVFPGIVLAANEGRSYIDAVDVRSGKHLARLSEGVAKPCCVERIPSPAGSKVRVLVSNIQDGSLQLVEVSPEGKMRPVAKAMVGKAPKRVAFMPTSQ